MFYENIGRGGSILHKFIKKSMNMVGKKTILIKLAIINNLFKIKTEYSNLYRWENSVLFMLNGFSKHFSLLENSPNIKDNS